MKLDLLVVFVFVLFFSPSTPAAWREASSDHFVIYADDSEEEIQRFSEKLERYRYAMTAVFPNDIAKPSPSNRVTVYIAGSLKLVQELYGDKEYSKYVGGYYKPRAGGSVAIIPSINTKSKGKVTWSEQVLMHEYAHHYLFEATTYLTPPWFKEGFAEYFSSAEFNEDGSIGIGLPSELRVYQLKDSSVLNVTLEQLLDVNLYSARKSKKLDDFHARSWLLFHYLYSDKDRRKSLQNYLIRLNAGEAELSAAASAFGDIKVLDAELKKYSKQKKFHYIKVTPGSDIKSSTKIRELNEAEAAIMPVRIRSDNGVNDEQAAEVVLQAREIAAKFPEDPEVLAALAEAEFDTGEDEAAIAAADQALARNPNQINALVQKGYALSRIAQTSKNPDAWELARKHFVSINRIENDHPIPLAYYYLSFIRQELEPTETAVRGLEKALELAPYDNYLRMLTATRQLKEKRFADTIQTLKPLAYSPHLENDNPAIKMLEEAKQALSSNSNSVLAN